MSGSTTSVRSMGLHDHLCWAYRDDQELTQRTIEFLTDGLAAGQRVAFVAPGPSAALRDRLSQLTGLDQLIAADHLRLLSSDDVYRDISSMSPVDQVAQYVTATEEALSEGFSGLRVAADVTPLVRSSAQRDAFAQYELLIDRYMADHPFTALCTHDARELDARASAELMCVHPLIGPDSTAAFQLFNGAGSDAVVRGEIDFDTVALFERRLGHIEAPAVDRWRLDVTELSFCDHRTMAALQRFATDRDVVVELRGAGAHLERLADLSGCRRVTVAPTT